MKTYINIDKGPRHVFRTLQESEQIASYPTAVELSIIEPISDKPETIQAIPCFGGR